MAAAPETPLSSCLRVASRPFGGEEYEYVREFAGPPVGENDDFMAFINLRWREAQARGHRDMVVSALTAPGAEDLLPGLLHQVNEALSRGDYESTHRLLDEVDGMGDRLAPDAKVVFSCRQGAGVHETYAAWRKGRECTYTLLEPLPRQGAATPPPKNSSDAPSP